MRGLLRMFLGVALLDTARQAARYQPLQTNLTRQAARNVPDQIQALIGRIRHRVETVFSTLTTVFNVERPRGRSLAGHVVRIATCILAHTLCFFIV